ncbi:MAG: fatty acid desaturase family protein, partial [Acidobacteriota bacterium]
LAEIRELHRLRPLRHYIVVARLIFWVGLCGLALWQSRWPWLWGPAAVVQGFNLLGFIILLHEQVHEDILKRGSSLLNRILGICYAIPAGISATQFRIWHLDHHNELGSDTADPKRAHLTPKINRRWYKLLYCSPALFFIYARAAGREARSYTDCERRTIARERLATFLLHLALAAALYSSGGGFVLLRVYVIPLFFCFPFAFILNRLGQHYFINPDDPANWSTLINANPVWHFLFLWSNFHIEHHYYPRVPFYNLKRLNRALQPFFQANGIKNHSYGEILWGWFGLNRRAHTNWTVSQGPVSPRRARQAQPHT